MNYNEIIKSIPDKEWFSCTLVLQEKKYPVQLALRHNIPDRRCHIAILDKPHDCDFDYILLDDLKKVIDLPLNEHLFDSLYRCVDGVLVISPRL